MSDIRITRFGQFLKRLTANFGANQGSTLVDDLMPVVPVLDQADVEHHWARDERVQAGECQVGAVAAQFSSVSLHATQGTDTLVVVEKAMVICATQVAIGLIPIAAAPGIFTPSPAQTQTLDTRWIGPATGSSPGIDGLKTRSNAVALFSAGAHFILPANMAWEVPINVVMGPAPSADRQYLLYFEPIVVNTGITVSLWWYLRHPVDQGELR